MNFSSYQVDQFFDELFSKDGQARPSAQPLVDRINQMDDREVKMRQKAVEAALFQMGVTFAVYGDKRGTEKIFPFDIIPRIIPASEWEIIEKGLKQRITALNLFLSDIYGEQKILKDNVIPKDLIFSGDSFRQECVGLKPPKGIWTHMSGVDLVRDEKGVFYVLEDNLRCPSGVSYVLENRKVLKRTWPKVFDTLKVRAIDDYPDGLLEVLNYISPLKLGEPSAAVLTPGVFNSAYFEHSFLAREMGIPLVEGQDLVVKNRRLYMKTTKGLELVSVLYRRVDDDFLDPNFFRSDSMLGVPGLMDAYFNGGVALANAPGTGIADDKAIYAFVPEMIKYYLNEETLLPNVPTYLCWKEKDRQHVLGHLDKMVVKAVNASGGYGMLMGNQSSQKDREEFTEKIKQNPRGYIAQPILNLSRAPVISKSQFEGRHVDLRPYILYGEEIEVMPGGLTRVALKKGSLVVNSSQGGGSKDTWVLAC